MKNLTLLCMFFLVTGKIFGQSYYPNVPHPEFFKTIPPIDDKTPAWAVAMYGSDPNIYDITEAYLQYYRTNPFVKTVHVQNYKYWVQNFEQYADAQGFIKPPTAAEEALLFQDLKNRKQEADQAKLNPWTSIGPFETYYAGSMEATSNQVNVYSLDQSQSNPDILYAGTESGALFKSTDHGLTWTSVTYGEPFAGGFGGIEIHPTNPNIVLVAVNNRIYRTNNGGSSWTEVFNIGAAG
jgi:hypothetical protein